MSADYEQRIKDYTIFNILEIKGIKEVFRKIQGNLAELATNSGNVR